MGSAAPCRSAVLTVKVVVCPPCTVPLAGETESEKSFAGGTQPGNLKVPMRVCQLKIPSATTYSSMNQKVQSSAGSTERLL